MWRRAGLVLTGLLFAFLLNGGSAKADVQDFTFTNFDASYRLTREDPQGRLYVTEEMTVVFTDQNRGILRTLPKTYKGNDLNIKVISVNRDDEVEKFNLESDSGNLVIRIGDKDVFITGEHTYDITYRVDNVISFYDEFDELYWDVNGDQWLQTFENVTAKITPPEDQPFLASPVPSCYTGTFGSNDSNCEFIPPSNGVGSSALNIKTTQPLGPNQTLTFAGAFEKGYFSEPTLLQKSGKYLFGLCITILQLLIALSVYRVWRQHGKDHPEKKITAPSFERPKRVSVLVAGYVYEQSLSPKIITATLIDLAIRGYIKIVESEKGGIIRKKKNYSLQLVKISVDLTIPEANLLYFVFPSKTVGEVFELKSNSKELYSSLEALTTLVDTEAKQLNYFEKSPKDKKMSLLPQTFSAVILAVVSFIIIDDDLLVTGIPFLIGVALLIFIGVMYENLKKRSISGVELKDHMDGLELYIKTAEKDRIALLQSAGGELNAPLPDKTIQLFETLLPYAIIFGLEKTWAKEFEALFTEPPTWYSGNVAAFNSGVLLSTINGSTNAMSSSFTSPGSGGGGGAGGGGGGGGGGGW